jgi:hypothetical protein
MNDPVKCPICKAELTAVEENGVTRYFCDCAGFSRPVVEIYPLAAPTAENEKKERWPNRHQEKVI